jgi:hypothetical protein
LGYFNDGTASNPSDPNTMMDLGHTRNAVYNIPIKGMPDVAVKSRSKAISKNDPDVVN